MPVADLKRPAASTLKPPIALGIRRNQLTRLRQLGSAGIRAEIGRVDL